MFDMNTGGRRGLAAAIFALLLTTAACGSQTGATDVDTAVPGAPAAIQQAPIGTSADAAERQGLGKKSQQRPVAGRRVPDAQP